VVTVIRPTNKVSQIREVASQGQLVFSTSRQCGKRQHQVILAQRLAPQKIIALRPHEVQLTLSHVLQATRNQVREAVVRMIVQSALLVRHATPQHLLTLPVRLGFTVQREPYSPKSRLVRQEHKGLPLTLQVRLIVELVAAESIAERVRRRRRP
jgi:hypothetical protein